MNSEVLTTHFATVEKLIVENHLDVSRIFILDESAVTLEQDMHGMTSSKRLMPRSGCEDLRMPEFRNLNRVTSMSVICASGSCAPPLFVFKGIKLPYRAVLKDGCVTTETPISCLSVGSMSVAREENGGIDTTKFLEWGYTFVDYVEPLTASGKIVAKL